MIARQRFASLLLIALAAPAIAQPTFFLAGKPRPLPAVIPAEFSTSSRRIPPAYVGQLGFRHWNLREFPNCQVPYAITVNATSDNPAGAAAPAAALNAARTAARNAVAAGFTTWQNVNPAVIEFNRRADIAGNPIAQQDDRNIMLWDGGRKANLDELGGPGSSTLAITFSWTNNAAQAVESDILFNDRDYQWNNTGMTDVAIASGAAPNADRTFPLANGDTLTISVNGAAADTVTFLAGSFANIAKATPAEVAAVINARMGALGRDARAVGIGNDMATPANQRNRVHLLSIAAMDGSASLQVTGGTANAGGKLAFPGAALFPNGADIQTIATHEIGHLLGMHHSSNLAPEPDAVRLASIMYWAAPDAGTKRNLTAIDEAALNFLYAPDLGDAPDPAAGTFNQYQTLVHGNANGRVLNGVQLTTTGLGPDHLFGHGPDYRFEWLGADEDGSANECEARVPDADDLDDGVTIFPAPPLIRGEVNHVRAKIKYRTQAGRYRLTNNDDVARPLPGGIRMPNCGDRIPPPAPTVAVPNPPAPVNVPIIGAGPNGVIDTVPNNCNTSGGDDVIAMIPVPGGGGAMMPVITTGPNGLVETALPEANLAAAPARTIFYLNAYADLNNNNLFDPAERLMFFSDIPNATLGPAPAARSLNFRSVSINGFANETEVAINLFVPRNSPPNLRFRFRLDYGEDEGRVPLPGGLPNGWEGDLAPAVGAAQFGEVEDYVFPTQAGPPVPDQLHIRGPYLVPIRPPNSPDQPSWLEAWVENNFLGASGQEVRFEVLSANAYFSNMNVTPNGIQASAVTGNIGGNPQLPGLVNAGVSGSAAGDGLIKVSVTDSPLVAYYVFKIPAARVIGDTTGDAAVGFDDIPLVLANFGQSGMPNIAGDANEDGLVNFSDITSVLSNFGAHAP